jgi:hydrogenase expression/formation protein HypC
MCLAVPGKIIHIEGDDPLERSAKVNFSGIIKNVNLSYVQEAKEGDYVIVHVGFALNVVDPDEAEKLLGYINQIQEFGREELGGKNIQ